MRQKDVEHEYLKQFRQESMLREAVASVSLSHPEACDCVVCRAASGDEQAMLEVMTSLKEA